MYSQQSVNAAEIGFFLLEGDSQDNTQDVLNEYANRNKNIHLIQKGATYNAVSSTEDPNRIASLSRLGSTVIDAAKDQCEYVLFVESDLILPPNLLVYCFDAMLNHNLENPGIISPIPLLENQNVFYDTWGFRNLDGSRWNSHPPYHPVLAQHDRFIPMSSIGSCALIKGEALRQGANFYEGAFVEMCRRVRELGYNIYADKAQSIRHPASNLVHGRWV